MHTAMSINTSECSGGAALLADLKTFTVLRTHGIGIVTGISTPASESQIPTDLIQNQLESVGKDLSISAFKTGNLPTPEIVNTVAEAIRCHGWDNFVCDPHLPEADSNSGLIHAYRKELLPLATVITLTRREAALLTNMDESDLALPAGAKKAAQKLVRDNNSPRAAVIKGLMSQDTITDLFYDGHDFIEFTAKREPTKQTFGAGSLFSAVITAMLAQRVELPAAIDHARSMVSQALAHPIKLGENTRTINILALTPE